MNTSSTRRVPIGLTVVLAVCLVVSGGLLVLGLMKAFPGMALFETTSESHDTQIVNAVTRQEQVVLLSLAVQGIAERSEKSVFLGMEVPGSERATFIQYGFDAKLGIEGKDVKLVQAGKNDYVISIPEFIFIGHTNESFKLVTEDNGVLSWVTPEIDTAEMISGILNDSDKDKYVASNVETLKDQARAFYAGIVASIDPEITVRVEFRQ